MNSAGLAIKDFWQVDDRTVVFVADPTFGKRSTTLLFVTFVLPSLLFLASFLIHLPVVVIYEEVLLITGNILNFNVGASVDLDIPRSFWSRLAGKYGNIFYWKEKVYPFSQCSYVLLA